MLKGTLGTQKPIIAMVHLQEFENMPALKENAFSDIAKLKRGGVDALMFENWGGGHFKRYATQLTKDRMVEVMREAALKTELPFGVNVLPVDYEGAFDVAKATGAKFVQVDTFVDRIAADYDGYSAIEVEPYKMIEYRMRQGLEKVMLMTNIQTKHYVTLPIGKPLETSVVQAINGLSDALVVTGRFTGEKTPLERILRVKKVAGRVPVIIGSGLTAENAAELLAHAAKWSPVLNTIRNPVPVSVEPNNK